MNKLKTFTMPEYTEIPADYYDNIKQKSLELGLKLTDAEVKEKAAYILSAYECTENCKQCAGLESCQNEYKGYEYVYMADTGYFTLRQCVKKIAYDTMRKNELLLSACHIPDRLRQKSIKGFDVNQYNQSAFDASCKQITGESNKGLILYGPVGTGKTHLVAAILNNHIIKGGVGIYSVFPELMDDLRMSIKNGTIDQTRKAVEECDVLFLDDLGTESVTDFVIEEFFKIINSRYLSGKKIIGTSNLDPHGLRDHYSGVTGDRIISRLTEMCDFVEINGSDKRVTK